MNTYWLTEKVGGIPRTLEMQTPGFFRTDSSASSTHTPEFLRELFGNTDSDEEREKGDAKEVQLNVAKLSNISSFQVGEGERNTSRPMEPPPPPYLPSRCRICTTEKYMYN